MDPDTDPAIFVIDLQDVNKKLILKKFFSLLIFEGTFISFFKYKKSKRSYKTVGIKVFVGSGSIPLTRDPDPGGPKTGPVQIRNTVQTDETGHVKGAQV
jgi:hypothetical protein